MAVTPEMGARAHADAVRLTEALAPFANGREYLNFAENPVDTRAAYGADVWTQLTGIRSAVDPHGVFVANHPVPRLFEDGRPPADQTPSRRQLTRQSAPIDPPGPVGADSARRRVQSVPGGPDSSQDWKPISEAGDMASSTCRSASSRRARRARGRATSARRPRGPRLPRKVTSERWSTRLGPGHSEK